MFHFIPLSQPYWLDIPEEARPRYCQDTKGIIAVNEMGEMEACCLLDTWTYNSCQIHIYIKNPFVLKHGFQQEVFNFAFGEESGREVIIGVTPEDNPKALKFIKHMGFTEVGRISDGFKRGVDFILTTLRKEDCVWIGDYNGQQQES